MGYKLYYIEKVTKNVSEEIPETDDHPKYEFGTDVSIYKFH